MFKICFIFQKKITYSKHVHVIIKGLCFQIKLWILSVSYFVVYLWKCKEFQKMFGIFNIIHVPKNIQQFIYFCRKIRKTKIVSNLTLEYDLKGLSWPLVGRTRFFEWLAARSRVFEAMILILQLIIFWIFPCITNKGRLGAYQCVGPYTNWCASHALFYATSVI